MPGSPEQLGWLIKRIQHRHHRALETALAPQGLSLVQWNALREIDRNQGASQHQLAELTFNSDQGFGALLSRLERLGLIERSASNGRARLPQLTLEGEAQLNEGKKAMSKVTGASFSSLSDTDRRTLERLLVKVLG